MLVYIIYTHTACTRLSDFKGAFSVYNGTKAGLSGKVTHELLYLLVIFEVRPPYKNAIWESCTCAACVLHSIGHRRGTSATVKGVGHVLHVCLVYVACFIIASVQHACRTCKHAHTKPLPLTSNSGRLSFTSRMLTVIEVWELSDEVPLSLASMVTCTWLHAWSP